MKKTAKIREAARKQVQAEAAKRPSRARPVINPATYTKICSVGRNCGGGEMLAEGNFFHVKALGDGYASRCKKCWNVRDVERQPRSEPEVVQTKRWYPPTKGMTIHTHTIAEERQLVRSAPAGHKLQGYVRVAGTLIPVVGSKDAEFLDAESRI